MQRQFRYFTSGLISSFFLSCSQPVLPNKETSSVKRPDQQSWDVTITLTEKGERRIVIQAGHLEKYDERFFYNLEEKIIIDFFDQGEIHKSTLYSDFAEINEETNYMRAIQNVVVKSDSGVTLYTDTLSWDNELEIIYSDDSVMVTTEQQDTLYGIGFESDVRMEHWKIIKPSGVTGHEIE